MIINVFGNLADIVGQQEVKMESHATVDSLISSLHDRYPKLKELNFVVSVNHEVVSDSRDLQEDDEVALLPPFSGG